LRKSRHGLTAALNLGLKELVAVVGGGGKSTFCLALSEALRHNGARVISSTTTKVRQNEALAYPRLVITPDDAPNLESILRGLDETGLLFVGRAFLENGKVEGISSALSNYLFGMPAVDYVITEADGAAGRPLKAPGENEPVVPESVTSVIALMGLSALGKAFGPDLVFRKDYFEALTGLLEGGKLDAEVLTKAFDEKMGLFKNAPVSARRIVFLNQSDVLTNDREALELARQLLLKQPFIEKVILGSFRKNEFINFRREDI
jgi:probable selenium-dependent hydroxylase accessory protein YqeC